VDTTNAPPTARPSLSAFRDTPFTQILFWLNALVYVGEVIVARTPRALFPAVPPEVAMAFGANYATATLYEGRIETLLTSCFVHFSLLHIGFNLYALRQVGPFLERAIGTGRFAIVYLAAGIVGSMSSTLVGWVSGEQRLGAGASGAICGLIGAAMVVGYRTQGSGSPLMRGMARWLGTVLVLGFIAKFDNAAHAGGAIGGALIALMWRRGAEAPGPRTFSLAVGVLAILGAGVVVLLHDLTDPFATMEANARLSYAETALREGRCDEAKAGAAAAHRVAPRAPNAVDAVRTVGRYCGR
jgi:rhomboid protease GluP